MKMVKHKLVLALALGALVCIAPKAQSADISSTTTTVSLGGSGVIGLGDYITGYKVFSDAITINMTNNSSIWHLAVEAGNGFFSAGGTASPTKPVGDLSISRAGANTFTAITASAAEFDIGDEESGDFSYDLKLMLDETSDTPGTYGISLVFTISEY